MPADREGRVDRGGGAVEGVHPDGVRQAGASCGASGARTDQ